MKRWTFDRRAMVTVGLAALLGACSVIPKGAERPGPVDTPTPEPTQSLPSDETRHRIALLVPMSGRNGAVGQSIANATTMALLDTNADNLRITTYDTAKGPEAATRQAIAEGNKLILGPLLGSNIASVTAPARAADVPVISFSNDTGAAGPDVFIMGHVPEQSIARTIQYARTQGSQNFAIIAPDGEYGARAEQAARSAVAAYGGNLVWTERFARGNTSIVSAAERLKAHGGFDTVLIADCARLAAQAARVLKSDGNGATQLLGTELWSGEGSVTRASALRGAWFSAVSDNRYKRFVDSYEARFGSQPYRIATLGYDAVLLTLRVARDWRVGRDFPDGAQAAGAEPGLRVDQADLHAGAFGFAARPEGTVVFHQASLRWRSRSSAPCRM